MDKLLWLGLKSVPEVGNYTFKKLIDKFQSPENVFNATLKQLLEVENVGEKTARHIIKFQIPDFVKKDYDLALSKNYKILTMQDEDYPNLLLKLPDPPPVLYVNGTLNNELDNIAIVGSRNATSYGMKISRNIAYDLVRFNIQVISGLARGIDTAAHIGALENKGKTIAVLGSGLENIYPLENKNLAEKIKENGAVISELPLLSPPDPSHFPKRNRIIAGISQGVLVVEAGKQSGSLITARLALEQGREVFAVPGNIQSFKSAGTHRPLKEGAKLVESAKDLIDELKFVLKNQEDNKEKKVKNINRAVALNETEMKVIENLSNYPEYIDDIAAKLNMETNLILSILAKLEIKGLVKQSFGKMFFIAE